MTNAEIVRILIIYFVLGFITAWYTAIVANVKGYNKFSWFVYGFFFTFIALIAIAGMPIKQNK